MALSTDATCTWPHQNRRRRWWCRIRSRSYFGWQDSTFIQRKTTGKTLVGWISRLLRWAQRMVTWVLYKHVHWWKRWTSREWDMEEVRRETREAFARSFRKNSLPELLSWVKEVFNRSTSPKQSFSASPHSKLQTWWWNVQIYSKCIPKSWNYDYRRVWWSRRLKWTHHAYPSVTHQSIRVWFTCYSRFTKDWHHGYEYA